MVIVSQDKEEIVNFNRVDSIWICSDEEGIFTIEATADTNTTLGEYTTKERAKEVLQDIISRYEAIQLSKMSNKDYGYTLQDYTPVYEMPKK